MKSIGILVGLARRGGLMLGLLLVVSSAAGQGRGQGIPPALLRLPADNEIIAPFDARGAAIPASRFFAHPQGVPLTKPSTGSPDEIARAFVRARLAQAGELVPLSVVDGPRGIRFMRFEQRFGGLRVLRGRIDVAILADGSVLSARVGELAGGPPPPLPPADMKGLPPRLDADAARAAALAAFGLPPSASIGPKLLSGTPPEAVLVALPDGAIRAWRVVLAPGGRAEHLVEVLVDAERGRLISVTPMVQGAAQGARVWPLDPNQPSQWVTFPDPVLRPSVDSPLGWESTGETHGNNTWVELDRDSNFFDTPPKFAVASGDPLVFDFPLTGDPRVDTDAAVTNVFWAINDAHDRFRRLGFDEASGACQADNLQRGGAGNDPVYGMVQWDGGDGTYASNFASMGIGADGNFNYLIVSLFRDEAGVLRDGALETDLLYHELTHSATIRLIGGDASCFNGAQPQAVSEGISDFMAVSFTNDPVIGAYTSGRPGRGMREFPIGGGGWSYVNLCEGGCDRYRDGEIVAGLLFDLQALLMQRLGSVPGRERAQQLALEAIRFGPCQPTLVDVRDAMLVADSALFDGVDRCTIWQAFAGRGVGASTITTGPNDQLPVGAYDVPPECSGGTGVSFDQREYSPDADAIVEVVDARLPAGATVLITSSGGDSVTLPVSAVGGVLLRGSLPIRPGAVDRADALLQVAAGDILSAAYAAAPTASAAISSTFPVRVNSHDVSGGSCQGPGDDDYVDPWYVLPGFIDAGEIQTVRVTLAHDASVPLEDVQVRVTSLNPNLTVLPAGFISLGDIAAHEGGEWRTFDLVFRANASPSVVAGELAPLRFDITSRGRSTTVMLTLELNMDYELVSGVSAFDGGVETFERGSSTASQWRSEISRGALNFWALEDCAGNGGSRGWRNGNVGCTDYSDGQVAATLISPPIFPLPPDAVAYRMRAFEWDTDVNLYTDPANGYCDADFVGMFVTTDPTTLPFDDPEAIYSQSYGACQRYWRPIYESTGGFARQRAYSFSDGARLIDPAYPWAQVRLAFIFWGDVYDCGFEAMNAGHFRLDNMAFSYDVMREVPETTPCTVACLVTTSFVMDPPGPKCPDEPFMLRSTTESSGCAGVMYHSFGGPGVPPEYGWTTLTEAPALGGADGGNYGVYSECETSPGCNDYHSIDIESRARPGVGGPWPDSLRVARRGNAVEFSWSGAAVPPAYAVLRGATRADLITGPSTWSLAATTNTEGPRGDASATLLVGAAEPGVAFFQVFGRDRCSDLPRIP